MERRVGTAEAETAEGRLRRLEDSHEQLSRASGESEARSGALRLLLQGHAPARAAVDGGLGAA